MKIVHFFQLTLGDPSKNSISNEIVHVLVNMSSVLHKRIYSISVNNWKPTQNRFHISSHPQAHIHTQDDPCVGAHIFFLFSTSYVSNSF